MNRRVAYPFLTLSASAVDLSPWELSFDGSIWLVAGEFLQHWDQARDVRIRRRLQISPDIAGADLSLSREDLQLGFSVRIGTGQGRLPRLILERCSNPIKLSDPIWEFEHVVQGHRLSSFIDLQTEIILAASPRSPAALSPKSVGSRLWSDSLRVRIEGEEPRFPIEKANFEQLIGGIAGAAPWYFHWSPRDWDRDFHGAVRLYLNENSTEFLERIQGEDALTVQVLLADVMSQICERFLLDSEAPEMMNGAEPGSLGAQASAWLRKAWPGKDAAFIRSVLESRPGIFHASIAALAEPGEE